MKVRFVMGYNFSVFIIVFSFLNCTILFGQIITANDDFEGEVQHHVPPPHWNNCDAVSSADTQPGIMNNHKPASNGNTYISLVTREIGPPGTIETVWAYLNNPYKKDSCYKISIDLSLSNEFHGSYNWQTYYFDNPCIFQIIGFNDDCEEMSDSEILWESDILSNFNWKSFNITIRPQLNSYEKIALRANFTPPDNHKNSVVLIDHLKIQDTSIVLSNNSEQFFLPDWAQNIQWYYEDVLLEDEISDELPFVQNGNYLAVFQDQDGCQLSVSKQVKLDYNETSLYPNPTSDQITIQYYSSEEMMAHFEVYNELGQLVQSKEKLVEIGINKTLLNLNTLASGVYYIKSNDLIYFPKSLKVVISH